MDKFQVNLPPMPQPTVAWFDLDEVNPFSLMSHQQVAAAQQAYINEQYANAQKQLQDAQNATNRAKAIAFARIKSNPVERLSKKGGIETVDCTDELAKYLVELDPEYQQASDNENHYRWVRDTWAGYSKSISTKIKMVMCLSGLTRAEIESVR